MKSGANRYIKEGSLCFDLEHSIQIPSHQSSITSSRQKSNIHLPTFFSKPRPKTTNHHASLQPSPLCALHRQRCLLRSRRSRRPSVSVSCLHNIELSANQSQLLPSAAPNTQMRTTSSLLSGSVMSTLASFPTRSALN